MQKENRGFIFIKGGNKMSIVIDLIVIAIIALFTFLGYKQGLVKVALKILLVLIAIVIAFAIYKPVSNLIIQNTLVDDKIKDSIINKIQVPNSADNQEVEIKDSFSTRILGRLDNTVEGIATAISVKILEMSTFIIIFVLLNIILRIVMMLTDLVTKMPIIKQINKLRRNNIGIYKRSSYNICNISSGLFSITFNETRTVKYNK